ncbi:MAG: hypothetical protein HY204_06045 [Nitrospirae bacterium]|nr:hypothetical protein [Nitrospirota bacterium]
MFGQNGFAFALLIASLLATAGCEQPPVKPTEDSRRLQQIDAFIEGLRSAYEGRNIQSFSAGYPSERQNDLKTIASALDSMTSPRLDFIIDRIVLQGETVRVALHWELRWQSAKDLPVKQRGNALFQFAGKSDLRLQTIEGDNPFMAAASVATPAP